MGHVQGIFVASDGGGRCQPVERVKAIEGVGLDGDRYADGEGTFSDRPGEGRHLTLIAAEAIEALAAEHGVVLEPGQSRRNIETRGVDLDALIGKRFRIGSAECIGVRVCAPCAYLEQVTRPGVHKGLAGRGGLRANILTSGEIAVGDQVLAL